MLRAASFIAEPPASLDFAELRSLINQDRARAGLAPLSHKVARRHVEGYGVRFIQVRKRGKLIVDGEDLHRSRLWAALQRRRRGLDAEDEEDRTG